MFEQFFITHGMPVAIEKGTYTPLLVIASYVIASLGSYVGLTLATYLFDARTKKEEMLLHWGGAFALGSGIWSMHFIGMLAFKMKMYVTYDPWLTALSMLIAVIIAYGVLQVTRKPQLTAWDLIVGATLLGLSICAMHYTGMAAMVMDADLRYIPSLFFLSVVIAITASGAALWLVFYLGRYNDRWQSTLRIIAALVMAAAICGMHYTGMAAAIFIPYADCRYDPDQRFDILAFAITTITSIIFGAVLALGVYNKEQRAREEEKYAFPTKLIALSMLLTFLALLWVGGNSFYIHLLLTHNASRNREIDTLSNEIIYRDNMLTQTARMAVATGDPIWETQYDTYAVTLRDDINKLRAYLRDKAPQEILRAIEEANLRLMQREKKSLKLVREGKSSNAQALLDVAEYLNDKQTYANSTHQLSDNIRGTSQQKLLSLGNNVYYALYLGIGIIAIVSVTWYFKLRSIRRWRGELEKARQDAEKANKAKSDFLANMSHEIRTPLNSMIGLAELVLETELTLQQENNIRTILRSGETLIEIINDLLDFSKIEAGKLELEPLPFDLQAAVEDMAELFAPKAREKERQLELLVDFMPGTPRHVIGDPMRLRQILSNLLSNALKFTQEGYILVSTQEDLTAPVPEGHTRIKISVQDTGIGIPSSKLRVIFDKFTQADVSTTRKFGGTGLGLSICRQLARMMQGEVTAQSVEGEGSIFSATMLLQRDPQPHKEPWAASHSALKGKRALIVDDLEPSRRILAAQLAKAEIESVSAAHPAMALKMLHDTKRSGTSFDLVITDYVLPEMTSEAFTQHIKELCPGIPVVIVTALTEKGYAQIFASAGCDAYLTKPVRASHLLDILAMIFEAKRLGKTLSMLTPVAVFRKGNAPGSDDDNGFLEGAEILLVEDHRANRDLGIKLLENLGCRTTAVSNGEEAIEIVKKQEFDLILMDCQMPEMDGFEASLILCQMKKRAEIADMPVVALTANAMKGDREKCLESGMNDYITKPLRKTALRNVLMQWLPPREKRLAARRQGK